MSKTLLKIKGLTAQAFLQWFHHAGQADLLAANPEHYIVQPQGNTQEVCETMDCYGQPMHFRIFFTQDEKIIPIELEKGYEFKLLGYGKSVADGKPMNTYAAHQFRNTADGFEALLQIVFPDCVPVELVKGHQTHLAIEFNNWVEMAHQAQRG
ncbi:hypothetical protein P7M32_06785 [Bisgaard Taxon 10/6]|uniref:Uncharacterized protein n=1 Tax=Exercitatus varius TaxID=67857 RepID=A0ABT6ERG1_9PAST|nr:hypothetical protein [Exercitatus varius]MDG2938666.1 hypothetical protein [Exercitatus varius]MDG2946132.1 hypothetical protein [Exercitatus varius]